MSILVLCLKKENVKSQKSQKVCLVLRQSVSEMFLWIDIFFPCQTTEIKNKKAKSVFLVLCLKIVLFVVLSFSEICPESSLCQFFLFLVVVSTLFIFRVNHMPPASLIPIFGIGWARHLSTFLLPFHFSGTIFTSNAWID